MSKLKSLVIIIYFALFSLQKSLAAEKNLQSFNTLASFEGNSFGNKIERQALNSFIEKPVSDKVSFGAMSHLSRIHSEGLSYRDTYALNYLEIFNRYKIGGDKKLSMLLQNSIKLPGVYKENRNLGLMPQQFDYEMRFIFAHNMSDRLVNTLTRNSTPYFARAEVAYRKRFDNPFDELRFMFWAGLKINQNFSLLLNDSIIWNIVPKADFSHNGYRNPNNFSASKNANNVATFSMIYHLNSNLALQFGYAKRLGGNFSIYDNHGFLIGLWNSL